MKNYNVTKPSELELNQPDHVVIAEIEERGREKGNGNGMETEEGPIVATVGEVDREIAITTVIVEEAENESKEMVATKEENLTKMMAGILEGIEVTKLHLIQAMHIII
jgi:hypothetical protein